MPIVAKTRKIKINRKGIYQRAKRFKYLRVSLSGSVKWGPFITKVINRINNKPLAFLQPYLRLQSQRLKEYKAKICLTLNYTSFDLELNIRHH